MFSVESEAVLASSSAETGISVETAAAATSASPALLGVTPMGGDLDSLAFNEAVRACGSAYLGVVAEHAAQRGVFAGTQSVASGVYTATEAMRASEIAL